MRHAIETRGPAAPEETFVEIQVHRRARLVAVGVTTVGVMLLLEAAEQPGGWGIGFRMSRAVTMLLLSSVAVWAGTTTLRRHERTRSELQTLSEERQQALDTSRSHLEARIQTEELLRQSEERMQIAIEAAKIGFLERNFLRGTEAWSDTTRQILGVDSDTPANFDTLIEAVHPDDRELLQQNISGLTPEKLEFALEHRTCSRDGSTHWVWMSGRGFFDEHGTLARISGIVMNVDERKHADQQYRLQAAALREAANAVVITDNTGTILWVNPAFTQVTGYSLEEAVGQNPRILRSGEHSAEYYAAMWKTIAAGEVWRGEVINRKKDGSLYTEEMTIAPVRSHHGAVSHFVAIKQDITERKRAEQALRTAEQQYRSVFENSTLGIFQSLSDGRFINVNPALAKMAGYDSPQHFLSEVRSVLDFYVYPERRRELLKQLATDKVVVDFELELKVKDGRTRTALLSLRSVTDHHGVTLYNEGTIQDITERKAAEERVRFLAYHDALTGLPNRTMFEERLAQALATARSRNQRVAVLWLDIDNFKTINDSLGHSLGDDLLRQMAERLLKHAHGEDLVARAGGDEFLLVVPGLESAFHAEAVAERIRRRLRGEYMVDGRALNVTCSLGMSLFPDHASDEKSLIRQADEAMYSAKECGRNTSRSFSREMDLRANERLHLETRLRLAVERGELFLNYQPEVDATTGRIVATEALLRWRNPELGLVPPDKFIPIAEDTGMINALGEWVLSTACAQNRQWQERGFSPIPIAVNISAVQLRQEDFVHRVRRVLSKTSLPPHFLELEITEGVLLSHGEEMLVRLKELAAMGVRLSIDDFGTGYSSLSYLKDMPVSKLKIDRSFIQHLATDHRDAAITSTVISMANSLSLRVLAEGVETGEQLEFLRAQGCHEIQGYLFCKPLMVDELARVLRGDSIMRPQAVTPQLPTDGNYGSANGLNLEGSSDLASTIM